MSKLDSGAKHILRLIARDKQSDGWATISQQLYPCLSKSIPHELVTFEKLESGGRAKLTSTGESIVEAMEWL